jgi:hypothetical protein
MTTLTQTPNQCKTRKQPQPVHGSARWVGSTPTQGMLDNGDAILKIVADGKEPAFYFVAENKDTDGRRLGFRLVKIDGLDQTATYDMEITAHGFRCDCPDATYTDRPGGCKHAAGLKAALKSANLL